MLPVAGDPSPPFRASAGSKVEVPFPVARVSLGDWDFPCQIRFTWRRARDEIVFFDDESVPFLLCVCVTRGNNSPCCLISVMCAAVGHAQGSKGRAQHAGSGIPGTIFVRSPCLSCLASPHKNGLPVPWGRDTPGRCDRAVAYHLIRGNESR